MKCYENLTLDEERALYGVENVLVRQCTFDGPADGESALKETFGLTVENCRFRLRYPLWHSQNTSVSGCTMTDTCRAALWYDNDLSLHNCKLNGIKAVREGRQIKLIDCDINSKEFGWFCQGVQIKNCRLTSEYPFLQNRDMEIDGLTLTGKYSFQYVENAQLRNCVLDTKDAFWHSKNVTVYDSVIKGEYLAWYSENLTLVRCKIIGTQPLCYAKNLVLEDCEMEGCDLSFEKSSVRATVRGQIDSVKNPSQGHIEAGHIGEIILDEHQHQTSHCEIVSQDAIKKCG